MNTNVKPQGASAPIDSSSEQLWRDALSELEHTLTRATFNRWLTRSALAGVDGDSWTIVVPNEEARDWLDYRLRAPIERAVAAVAGRPVALAFAVGTAPSRNASGPEESTEQGGAPAYDLPKPGPGQASIKVTKSDPNAWYLSVPHYAQRFWRPILGIVPFTLWEVLRSYEFFYTAGHDPFPTIEMLADSMGYGNRYTLLGRAASGARKEQEGAIDVLVRHRVCHHWTEGQGTAVIHYFNVLETLPVLTPSQLATLSARKQREHGEYLKKFKGFNAETWQQSQAETNIADRWWEG